MSDGEDFKQQYNIGDTANGYVLAPEGWKPVPPSAAGGTPTVPVGTSENTGANPQYQVGDVANGYVLTPQGWQPAGQTPAYGQVPAYGTGPNAGGPSGPVSSRRGLYIALSIAAVVILSVAAAGTYAWVSLQSTIASPKTPTPTSRSTTRATSPSTTRPTSPTTRPTPTATAAPGAKTFRYGEAGSLTLKGAPAGELKVDKPVPFAPVSDLDKPEQGHLVYVPVTVKVTGQQAVSVSDFDFVAVLPDGKQLESAFVIDLPKDAPPELDATGVKTGQTVTGSVAFDVPKDTALKIAYQPELEILGTWTD